MEQELVFLVGGVVVWWPSQTCLRRGRALQPNG